MKRSSVALVGRRLEHNDHLGIGYLEAALAGAAVRRSRHVLNHIDDVLPIARSVCKQQPAVVGLSLQDGASSVLPLALGELLRRLGYHGHITVGGPFATLARTWLLGRYAWLDSVVRFAGEAPLLALVRALARGESIACVPGLSTRAGDGPPADVLNPLPTTLVPVRHEGMRMLGRKVAHVSATRGCAGRCSYCGPAALQDAEVEEGMRAGHSRQQLLSSGVGGIRRRKLADVADELAGLARSGHGYAYFVDEHVLPYREADALAWLSDLQRRLKAAKAPKLALGCMLRSERVTQAVAQRFAEIGLARCFLGIEFPSAEQGRWFRRQCNPERALSILQELDERGVATVSNLMLVHPNSMVASIEEGLRFLERIEHGLFDVTRMKAYHGTQLYQRLLGEGRLHGNPLRWDYRLADPVAQRFTGLLARVRIEALGDYGLTHRFHDIQTVLAVARRLDVRQPAAGVDAALMDLRARLNAFTIESLRKTLASARDLPEGRQADELVHEVAERARGFGAEIKRLEADVDHLFGTPERRFSPMAAAAASSLIFLFASTNCGSHPMRASRAEAGVSVDAQQAQADVQQTQPETTGFVFPPPCGDDIASAARARVAAAVPCFAGWIGTSGGCGAADFCAYFNPAGRSYLHQLGCDQATQDRFDELEQAATASLVGLNPGNCGLNNPIDKDDQTRLADSILSCQGIGYAIVLDSNGAVVDVRGPADGDTNSQVLDCILAALAGLTFPCLAGTQICSEEICEE